LERLEFSLEGENFSTILLCIGANDGLQGKSLSELETNLKQIIERLKRTEAKIIFFGMQIPPNL
jgi:acyl-CoA thioesterase-1